MTDAERLLKKFEAAYAGSDIKIAMAEEILTLLKMLEKAEKNQSSGYMRKNLVPSPVFAPVVYPEAIDDGWIKTGVSNG